MIQAWRASVLTGLLAIDLPALLGGCSGDPQVEILQNQVPQSGCVITTDRTVYRGSGVLDASLVSAHGVVGYELFPLVHNGLPPAGDPGGPEPNRVYFRALRVKVELAASTGAPEIDKLFQQLEGAGSPLLQYDEPWSGSVDPGGMAATAVTAVPGELARQILATGALARISHVGLTVRAKLLGDRSTGSITSSEFTYPIDVCAGCLVSMVGPCPAKTASSGGNACNLAQDQVVDCCTDGSSLVCPARTQ